MKPTYYLVGFDRGSELAVRDHVVPTGILGFAMDIAGLSPELAELGGDWPLSDEAAIAVAARLGVSADIEALTWCLEPVDASRDSVLAAE